MSGRICLVTGVRSGLGRALADTLAATRPYGETITQGQVDVTDRAAIENRIDRVHITAGRVDALVNNAAFVRWQEVTEMSVEEAERTMRTGYDAMVYGIKAVLPRMLAAAGGGRIVTIGSSAGRIHVDGPSAAYVATPHPPRRASSA